MPFTPRLLLAAVVASLLMLGFVPAAAAHDPVPDDSTQLVVKVRSEDSAGAVAALQRHIDVVDAEAAPAADLTGVLVAEGEADEALALLNADPRVEYAERDVVLSAATHDPNTTGLGEWWPKKIGATQVWPRTTGTSAPVIAVIDTGVDAAHPDLVGSSFTQGQNFVVDTTVPIEPVPGADDDNGHGTAVVGAIAAQHNDMGSDGMCPRCTIMPLKALNHEGEGSGSAIAAAVDYAVANGADIINLSLAGWWIYDSTNPKRTEFSQNLREAIEGAVAADVLVVAAAGNANDSAPEYYPAVYPGVLAVAGSDHLDARYVSSTASSSSNYGTWVDMAAPGCVYGPKLNATYGTTCGTSLAAPLVSGAAGLLKTVEPSADDATMTTALTSTAVDVDYVAEGRLDAGAAFDTLDDAPDVAFTAPAAGAWVRGAVPLTAAAADDLSVTKVDFSVDGVLLDTVTGASPHTTSWDTALATQGSHTLSAVATDNSGLTATATRSVTVDRTAPLVGIDAPVGGATLSGTTLLTATAADGSVPVGAQVTGVSFAVNGTVLGTDTTAPFTWSYDTTSLSNGSHALVVTATDRAGNTGTATRAFTVDNEVTPTPTTTLDPAPTGGGGGGGGGGGALPTPSESPTPTPTPSATPSPTSEAAFTDPVTAEAAAGETVHSDAAALSSDRPVNVAVTTPVAGTVSITRSLDPATAAPQGYSLLGVETVISAPEASAADPLLLEFRVHSSLLDGLGADGLRVLRNGVLVQPCTGAGATPDPCLASLSSSTSETLLIVRTSRASVWNFARPAVACPGAAAPTGFADVRAGSTHADAIACATQLGVARGIAADRYGPAAGVTRAQMATFVSNALAVAGFTLPAGSDAFADDDGNAHEAAINRLAAAGIVSGVSDGRYGPAHVVTREQMATFLVRAHEHMSATALPGGADVFSDDNRSAHEANINTAAAAGFASGVTASRFDPAGDVRRDQMASFLVRVLDHAVASGLARMR